MKTRVWDLWIVQFGSESDAFVRQLVNSWCMPFERVDWAS
jgi:hypothetical protein